MNKTLAWPCLFLIFFSGAFLRFHALDRQSLWDDEMSTLLTVTASRSELLPRFETVEVHPPLYYLQLKIWMKLAGRSLVRIRANSALWGSLTLLLIAWLGVRYSGWIGGLCAAGLTSFSPLHLSYSQEARPYALAIALGCAALVMLECCMVRPERRRWIGLTVLWICLLYTHYWGAFVVAAQGLYGLYSRVGWKERRPIVLSLLVSSALFALWLPVLHAQMGGIRSLSFWVEPFNFLHPLQSLVAFTGIYFKVASSVFFLRARIFVLLALGIPFAVLIGYGIYRGPLAAVFWLFIGIGLPWLISLYLAGIYVWYRYPTLMYPAFVLLIVAGIFYVRPRWLGAILFGLCIGSQLWGCRIYFGGWQKANPKAVIAYVHSLNRPGTIVVRPSYFANLYNFYDGGSTRTLDEHLLDSPEKRSALKGKDVIFLGFDGPDPVGAALLQEFHILSGRYFPGYAHLGITVWQLQ